MLAQTEDYTQRYQDIGRLLYAARQEKQMSIAQAAQQLHIRARYLEALEKGSLNDLPGLPYAKGYLQTYATFLKLDKDEVLRRFEQVEILIEKRGFYIPEVFSKAKNPERQIIVLGLAGALVIYLLWWVAFSENRMPVSLVEPYQEATPSIMKAPAGGVILPWTVPYDVACVKQRNLLYPPCHWKAGATFSLLPLHERQMNSVMNLAEPFKTYE